MGVAWPPCATLWATVERAFCMAPSAFPLTVLAVTVLFGHACACGLLLVYVFVSLQHILFSVTTMLLDVAFYVFDV